MGRGNEHRDRRRQFGAQPTDSWGDYAPSPSYAPPARQQGTSFSSGSETEARVKWFNPEKGFGFVDLTDGSGEAFLHIRQVEAAGHSALESGTTLVVTVGTGQKGPQVMNILSVDASTAAPEPPRRGSPSRAGHSGGNARHGIARPELAAPTIPGVVKWFDLAKGFGFVTVEGESKDLFLHISVVERAGLGALTPGQAVRVAIVEGRKGREVGAIEAA
ncbi:cold-shock protein [Microvirga sp. M2]|uniref:cold-shock protein n=1 Tax=Microvirga sp. M2 TaxID=3073270 RepID=UPI0039C08DBF